MLKACCALKSFDEVPVSRHKFGDRGERFSCEGIKKKSEGPVAHEKDQMGLSVAPPPPLYVPLSDVLTLYNVQCTIGCGAEIAKTESGM